MSAVFTQSGTQHLVLGSNPVTANSAFWMACWVKPSTTNVAMCSLGLGATVATEDYSLRVWSDANIYFYVTGSASANSFSASNYSANTWQLVVGVSSGSANRTAYLGSTAGSTDTTTATVSSLNRIVIGHLLEAGTYYFPFTGKIAEPTIWSGAPSGGSIASLAGGADPSTIDAGNILFHESLYSGAGTLTNTGTVTFDTGDHPIAGGGPVTTIRPDSTSATGNWLTDTGSANLHLAIDEAGSPLGADYIISGVNPVADTCKIGLSNFVSHTPTGEVVRYEYYKAQSGGTGTINLRVRLLEGSTERASWTHSNISTTPTTAEQSLSSVEFAAITDRDNQFLEFTANP